MRFRAGINNIVIFQKFSILQKFVNREMELIVRNFVDRPLIELVLVRENNAGALGEIFIYITCQYVIEVFD